MKTIFLGWDTLPLGAVLRYLVDSGSQGPTIDLQRTALLLPSGRAGRRLLELLVDYGATTSHWISPPLLLTPSTMIETLYHLPEETIPNPLFDQISWCEALERLSPDATNQLALATGSAILPFAARWSLADKLSSLHRELSAQQLSFSAVAARIAAEELPFVIPETQVAWWQILSETFEHRRAVLAAHGLVDAEVARWNLLESTVSTTVERLVVACCPDLSLQAQQAIAAFPGEVEILIHAPEELAEGFTTCGTVNPPYWCSRTIQIPDHNIVIATDPRQEALAVVDHLANVAQRATLSQCTIAALADESRRALHAMLRHFSIPFFDAEAPPPPLGTLTSWLKAATDFARTAGRGEAWRLLRHPHSQGLSGDDATPLNSILDNLDEQCVQSAIPQDVPPHAFPPSERVEAALSIIIRLLEPFRQSTKKPLKEWVAPLTALFDGCHLSRHIDASTHRSLETLVGLLRDTPSETPIDGFESLSILSDAFSLVHTPETESSAAIDLLGWLELHLDDAPHLTIAGLVENVIPEVLNGDPFLPNTLRVELGLPSNESRLGRDSYLLSALLASRNTRLFLHRHLPDGSQTLPSRLLYRDEPSRCIAIAQDFFLRNTTRFRPAPRIPSAPQSDEYIPAREPSDAVPKRLRLPVTALKLYNQCPYRFYLKYIQKLETITPPLYELDARLFGSLTHTSLQSLANASSEILVRQQDLHDYLMEALDKVFNTIVGTHPSQAARLQRESARLRIGDFVTWQVATGQDGWYPMHVEFALDPDHTFYQIGDTHITLNGRIDRIDKHQDTGEIRVLDFKTGSQRPRVWSKTGGWIDPQLPLYALLLHRHPTFSELAEDKIQVCHVMLDGAPNGVAQLSPPLPEGSWTSVADFLTETLTMIAQGVFWPPSSTMFSDEYASLIGTPIASTPY